MNPRIDRLGVVKVEHLSCKDYGPADWQAVPKVVQHTTEGGFESALAKLRLVDTPTFLLGRDKTGSLRCIQFLDLGRTAGALEHPQGTPATNGACFAQIELVGFSQTHRWLPDPGATDALAHLYAELSKRGGVPLRHVPNKTRNRKRFATIPGFYGHCDVPDQPSGHWDPGDLAYPELMAAASRLTERPAWYDAAAKLEPLWAWILWRDHGAPARFRPPQIPARIPAAWWARLALHRGT